MALFIYQNPNTLETIEIVQSMLEKHEYEKDGVKWNRIFSLPNASIDTKCDPFSQNSFVEKTGKGKGSYGDLLDRSREMSEKREKTLGKDPLKEAYYDNYSKTRKKGIKHRDVSIREGKEKLSKMGVDLVD